MPKVVARQASAKRRSVIVGAGSSGQTLAREIIRSRDGYEAVGFVDDDPQKTGWELEGLPVLGRIDELGSVIHGCGADTVIVAISNRTSTPQLPGALLSCEQEGIRVLEMPAVFEALTGKVPVEHVERSWFAEKFDAVSSSRGYSFWKRAGDVVLSTAALIGFSLALPAAALAIKLDSRGPVFFSQGRVGRGRRVFRLHKLRTMVDDAEASGDPVWAETDDTRVTRVGRLLRRFRFDEFPQFWNVLRGQMSVVGPRPERPFFVELLKQDLPHYDFRHEVKPGITGWAQVCQGYASSSQESFEKLQFDLYYLKHRSLMWDLTIVLKTARVVLLGIGAR